MLALYPELSQILIEIWRKLTSLKHVKIKKGIYVKKKAGWPGKVQGGPKKGQGASPF